MTATRSSNGNQFKKLKKLDITADDLTSMRRAMELLSDQYDDLLVEIKRQIEKQHLQDSAPRHSITKFHKESDVGKSTVERRTQQKPTTMERSRRSRSTSGVRQSEIFEGHAGKVFSCQWSPIQPIIATAGEDSTARLWNMSPIKHLMLRHCVKRSGLEVLSNKGVYSVNWNASGSDLVTGSGDGYARIWTKEGILTKKLEQNIGPIFEAKWNKTENYILCAGVDGTSVWDVSTQSTQRFSFHLAQVTDIDWCVDDTFASCGKDNSVFVCSMKEKRPIRSFFSHTGEVNAVMWNNKGNYLASCSEDTTVKVWDVRKNEMVRNLTGHTKQVRTVKWSPNNLILASGSDDFTVRLWDFLKGDCLHILEKHREPVQTIAFSEDGKLLATGSWDKFVHIWLTESGQLVQSHKCLSGVTRVSWNSSGIAIAASTLDGDVLVLRVRKF